MNAELIDATNNEMNRFHSRILRIINIDQEEAKSTYKLATPLDVIENTCLNIMSRILSDPSHPVTSKLPRTMRPGLSLYEYNTQRARTEAYANSFVQKFTKILRTSGRRCAPTAKAKRLVKTSPIAVPDARRKHRCKHCLELCINLGAHKKNTPRKPTNKQSCSSSSSQLNLNSASVSISYSCHSYTFFLFMYYYFFFF